MKPDPKTIPERLQEQSPTACALWRISNALRIIGYSILFIGPWFAGVCWLFDFLRDSVDADPDAVRLKEKKFYLILAASLLISGGLLGAVSSCVQSRIERKLERQEQDKQPD